MGVAHSADRLIEDLQAVVRDAEALLLATAGQGGDRIEGIRSRAAESLQRARKRLAAAEEDVLREVRKAAGDADDYVRHNPWQAVGAAVGLGLLLGLLISRR
jgi:ElaB/YqjD/DUF883 family membrane-anchored ribosome-binding protein